ncbi:hypothetical protein L7F22_057158 [Adiantum nelumboides]|nr:hypothetical protein [Adiantum nelumboides]
MKYIQIVEQIREWWEKSEGLWNEWKEVINVSEQKETVKEFKAGLVDFRVEMCFWKRHMHVPVKHFNALLQLNIEASKIPEKEIENLATNEDTYREIGEILFEARVKANQPEPAGWLATASHCHKLARAKVTRERKTLYCPKTKEWLKMTPYEQQMIVKEPEVFEQTAVYRIIKKQTAAQAMEGESGKMSASDPNSAIYVTDSLKDIKNKVNKYAFSGGGATIEEHRKNGANLEVDVPIKYLTFFLEDDEELAQIKQEYGAGRMLTGEVKRRLIEVLSGMVDRHQKARAAVTDEMVDAFMAVRPLPQMFS